MSGMSLRQGTPGVRNVQVQVLCAVLLATLSSATAATTTTTTTTTASAISTTLSSITQDTITPSPQSLPSSDIFSNVTLRKCKCDKDEVWFVDHCVETITTVPCLDQERHFDRNTSDFSAVSIGEPVCKEGFTYVTLPLESYLFLTPGGAILWESGNMLLEDYCIEHTPLDGRVILEGRACLPPPSVPQCCPEGYILDEGSCRPDGNHSVFAPPVFVSNEVVAGRGFVRDTVDTTCSADDDEATRVTYVTLSPKASKLSYVNQQALLKLGREVLFSNQKDYCVGMKREGENSQLVYIAKVCAVDRKLEHQKICSDVTCIRKCCPDGTLLYGVGCLQAMTEEEKWRPVFHDHRNHSAIVVPPAEDWRLVDGLPLCSDPLLYSPNRTEKDEFYLLTNGSLHLSQHSNSFLSTDYCTDLRLQNDFSVSVVALVCPLKDSEECSWRHTLVTVLRGVSCVFLTATVLIYLGVPDLRDRTNGRCLVSMAVAMIATHLSIIVVTEMPHLNDTECRVAAFFGHVNALAMFFWLNVMCFDMWSTLRSSKQQHHSLKVFALYSAYAWGCPLLVGMVGIVLDLVQPEGAIIPNFTVGTCWFTDNAEFWLYLSGFVLILVTINVFFFVHVAVSLGQKMQQRKRVFEGRNDKATNTKAQVWLYVKLFIVMGVMWIAEIVSSIHHRKECKIWVLADVINASQGVFIFLVAICNKDNLKKVRSAWRPRVARVSQSVAVLRGTSTATPSHAKNLSVDMSDASRKTSVTSLPRKLSAVSNIFFSTGHKHNSGTDAHDQRRGSETPSPRKYSSVSTHEQIMMDTLAE